MPFIYQRFKIEDVRCLAIYRYDGLIKDSLLALKVHGDIAIAKIFLGPIKNYLKSEYQGYQIVPTPSLASHDKKRGFNHVQEIFKVLDMPIKPLISKTKNWKQSDQHFDKRSNVRNILKINGPVDPKQKILLVDDILTTGETLRASIKLLRKEGVKEIRVLAISKHV